nr:MAG TPA: poly(ADP-ribose) glycohydrolase [Bacteriophage sp.]
MKREELKQHAQAHYADIKVRLKEETNRAIINSEIFGPNLPFSQKEEKTYHNTFYLKDQDSVSCLFSLTDRSKAAVLNYASYKHPGGYFLGGSSAQEEALCHLSYSSCF